MRDQSWDLLIRGNAFQAPACHVALRGIASGFLGPSNEAPLLSAYPRADYSVVAARQFPLTPARTAELEVGDFWAVQLTDGRFGCLQITSVRRSGPASRTTFYAAVVDWAANQPPTADDIRGRDLLVQGLTRFEVFTKGGAQVIGNATPAGPPLEGDNVFEGRSSGLSHVWGWRAVAGAAERALAARGV